MNTWIRGGEGVGDFWEASVGHVQSCLDLVTCEAPCEVW